MKTLDPNEEFSLADEELSLDYKTELESFYKGLQLLQRLVKSAKKHSQN